jgi:dTMP kinase
VVAGVDRWPSHPYRDVVPGALQHEVMLRRPGTSCPSLTKRGSVSASHRFTLRRARNDGRPAAMAPPDDSDIGRAARYTDPMTGRFITFEGGDGAGKSTQVRRLAARLGAAGKSVVTTREPGGTPLAEAIRRLILSGGARDYGPEGEALLFGAARADHVEKLIRPALNAGEWVISDRFFDSTHVYQGIAGVDGKLLAMLDRVTVGRTRPDLTVILDLPVELGRARLAARLAEAGAAPDRFEGEAPALHEQRRQAFLAIAAREPERCAVVDAGRGEDEVADDVWGIVSARLLHPARQPAARAGG